MHLCAKEKEPIHQSSPCSSTVGFGGMKGLL